MTHKSISKLKKFQLDQIVSSRVQAGEQGRKPFDDGRKPRVIIDTYR